MKAVLVDLDGTLIDLPTDYENLRAELRALFQRHGVDLEFRPMLDTLTRAKRELAARGVPPATVEAAMAAADATIARYELAAMERATSRPGAAEFLERVRAQGTRIAVVTNNSRTTVLAALRRFELADPDVVIARGDATRHKPMPDPALAALTALAVRPEEALMIGDDARDAEMGRAAGIRTLLVRGNLAGPGEFHTLAEVFDSLEASR